MPQKSDGRLYIEARIAQAHRNVWLAWELAATHTALEGEQLDLEKVLTELERIQLQMLKR